MPIARTVLVPSLPGGRVISLVERLGEVVLCYTEGNISPQAAEEMTDVLQTALDTWTQNWSGPDGPPQASAN